MNEEAVAGIQLIENFEKLTRTHGFFLMALKSFSTCTMEDLLTNYPNVKVEYQNKEKSKIHFLNTKSSTPKKETYIITLIGSKEDECVFKIEEDLPF
jgi:hypothetical protein